MQRLVGAIESSKKIPRNASYRNNGLDHYEGKVGQSTFLITRVLQRRNKFLPTVTGVVSTAANGTAVKVKVNLNLFVIAIIVTWIGAVAMFSVILSNPLLPIGEFMPYLLIPAVLMIVGIVVVIGGFKKESKRARVFLRELLEAQEGETPSFIRRS